MVLEEHGYLSLSEHPELKKAVEWKAARGNLVRVLGNCYTDAHAADSLEVRVTAARLTYPNAVFLRETAARLSWWSEPLTVLDLTDVLGGAVIDEALRRSAVTLDDLHHALECTRGRRGNKERARLVAESRDEPWSELERQAHVILRQSRFPGWVANHPVEIRGKRYCIDLAVPELKLAAEIDGWAHHKTFQSFVSDRRKWNDLTLDKCSHPPLRPSPCWGRPSAPPCWPASAAAWRTPPTICSPASRAWGTGQGISTPGPTSRPL